MLPLIPIALSLAKIVPDIVSLVKGDKSGEKAKKIVDLAKSVVGVEDPQQAVNKILEDPKLALEFQNRMNQLQLEFYREETKRLEIINKTMRVEYESKNTYKTGWRPFIGWTLGFSIGFYIFSLCTSVVYAVFYQPDKVSLVIDSLSKLASALTSTWIVCMTILGVAIKKRSDDKKVATGDSSSLFEALSLFLGGKK